MLGALSVWHWVALLVVISLVFGRGVVSGVAADFAKAIKEVRKIGNDVTDIKP